MINFVAIDVETANSNWRSICQIGICFVKDGEIYDEWETLVNPEESFSEFNVSIHGIEEHQVIDAPKLPDIYGELRRRLDNSVLVSHFHFDRIATKQACEKYSLGAFPVTWLDSGKIAKSTWPHLGEWNLPSVASHLGLRFQHHDALEDARIAAKITLQACRQTQRNIDDWIALT